MVTDTAPTLAKASLIERDKLNSVSVIISVSLVAIVTSLDRNGTTIEARDPTIALPIAPRMASV